MTHDELVAAIGVYLAEDDGNTLKLAQSIRKNDEAKPLAEVLINAGVARKKGETTKTLAEKDTEIERLNGLLEQAAADAETAKAKPDEKQAAHDREKAKLVARAEAAEKAVEEQRTGRKGDAVNLARSRFLSALKGRVDDFGLDAIDRRFSDRFRAKDDLSGVEVLDEDGDPIEAPKGKTAEEILAEKAFETVPASNRLRQMNAGGGSSGGGSQGTVTREQLMEQQAQSGKFSLI